MMESRKKPINESIEILIVEDSPTQAEQLKYFLEESGYNVLTAADGNEALIPAKGNTGPYHKRCRYAGDGWLRTLLSHQGG